MRITALMFLTMMVLVSCVPQEGIETSETSIPFITTPVQSQSLLVAPQLTCDPQTQRLELNIRLASRVPETIVVKNIILNNSNGLNSADEHLATKPINIRETQDTTILLTFNHVNDKYLFQATGLPGLIDSVYNLSVFYSVDGKEAVRVVNLSSKMPKEKYSLYKKTYDTPIAIYYFNTTNGFDEKERLFLKTNSITKTPPFVHITEQEAGVAGLNFRIKSFHRRDTLHTEIFAVNHSDLSVRIDPSGIDMIFDGLKVDTSRTEISSEKVTGAKDETEMLGKGDRIIIKMKKYVPIAPDRLWLTISRSFFLSTGLPLFADDLELIRAQSTHQGVTQ
jgi:hypothetical protein